MSDNILVTGATGGQGGAVVRALLGDGWVVHALVRDPGAVGAKALEALGADLVVGDLDDPAGLRVAARGMRGVFSVQAADFARPDPETEIRRGRNVADAALAAGAHLVYSSVAGADRETGVAHFASKARVEEYIWSIGATATVLRPVFFMENWEYLLPETVNGERVVSLALDADTPLQMIALADIGRIVADAFDKPSVFVGVTAEIAGDEVAVRRIGELFSGADGVPTRFVRRAGEELWAEVPEYARMYRWIDAEGFRVDIDALRDRYPGLLTFATWLRGRRS